MLVWNIEMQMMGGSLTYLHVSAEVRLLGSGKNHVTWGSWKETRRLSSPSFGGPRKDSSGAQGLGTEIPTQVTMQNCAKKAKIVTWHGDKQGSLVPDIHLRFAGPVFLFALGSSEERSLITALSSATHSLPGATDMSAPQGLLLATLDSSYPRKDEQWPWASGLGG